MKIKGSIEINKPRNEVVNYFLDPQYLGEYQDGFIKKELLIGEQGKQNAISKLYYKEGKQKMELRESITKNQLPDLFEASYSHKHMDNTMKSKFIILDKNRTKYEYEIVYQRIDWILPKLIAIFLPSVYKNPVKKWIKQFKEFIEKQ